MYRKHKIIIKINIDSLLNIDIMLTIIDRRLHESDSIILIIIVLYFIEY